MNVFRHAKTCRKRRAGDAYHTAAFLMIRGRRAEFIEGELPAAAIPVCPENEIRCGDAEVCSDVSGQRESYSAKILRVYKDEGCRDLLLQITDPRLIDLTGGIVQGMSGSPIVQNGRLVGAVTHVLVSDPLKGYGISAEAMLRAEQGLSEAA